MRIKALVDRIEGDKAVLLLGEEEEAAVDFPKSFLPGVKEGDIVTFKATISPKRTAEAKAKVVAMIDKLKKINRGV